MGRSVSTESSVLKLVYPGGFVETYKKPITAAEVMKRNPRHCVTRPDVFKFPWVVVKPESVLKPGRVFYIVPYHTLHRLMQSKGPPNRPFRQEEDSDTRLKVTSRIHSWEHPGAAYQGHDRMHRRKDPTDESSIELTHFHRLVKKGNPVASENKVSIKCEDWPDQDFSGSNFLVGPDEKYQKKFYRKQSLIQEMRSKKDRSDHETPKKQYLVEDWSRDLADERTQVNLFLESKPSLSLQYAGSDDDVQVFLPRFDRRPDLNSSQQITSLKSCLKKHDNVNKPSGFRVRFDLDEDHHHKKLGMHVQKLSTE